MNRGVSRTSRSDVQSTASNEFPTSPTSTRINEPDARDDLKRPVDGWPSLAKLIAEKPDLEAFPSFTDLNIKSLLYYQAELISLRRELHEAEYDDFRRSVPEGVGGKIAEDLDYLFMARDEDAKFKQWELIERIRVVLEKYNAALLQFSSLCSFPDANNCNVKSLREVVKRITQDRACLTGPGSKTWGRTDTKTAAERRLSDLCLGLFIGSDSEPDEVPNEFEEHLIVPRENFKQDSLTRWVIHSFVPLYHHCWRHTFHPVYKFVWTSHLLPFFKGSFRLCSKLCQCGLPHCEEGKKESSNPSTPNRSFLSRKSSRSSSQASMDDQLTSYPEYWIVRTTSILTTIVACLLPTVAITVLSRVQTMGMILGLIALFTAAFAFGLVLLSSTSSRVEIFTATAAFSAVMVVFVQNKMSRA